MRYMQTEERIVEDKIRVLLTEEEVNRKISEVAAQISRDYAGRRSYGETDGFIRCGKV